MNKHNYNIDKDIEMLIKSEIDRNYLYTNYFLISLAQYEGYYNINN